MIVTNAFETSLFLAAEVVSTDSGLKRLGPEWIALYRRSKCENVFLTYEWMSTWWKHWKRGRTLAIVAIRDSSKRLVALAPLCIERRFGLRRLAFIGDDRTGSDYLNIIAESGFREPALQAIAQILATRGREWDYIELRDAEPSPLFDEFCSKLEAIGLKAYREPGEICYHVPLPQSFDAYLAAVGLKLRANFRRRLRLLEKEGAQFVAISDPEELSRNFPELLRLHRMRFESSGRQSAVLRRGVPEFHAEALRALAPGGSPRLYFLQVKDELIAAIYGFSMGKTFQFYQVGMNPAWMKSGVGQVLIGCAIRESIATGHADFDFLRGAESYKTDWADSHRRLVTARFFDKRPASVLALWSVGARRTAGVVRSRIKKRLLAFAERIRSARGEKSE